MSSDRVVSLAERAELVAAALPAHSGTPLPLIWARDAGLMLDVGYLVKGIIARAELLVIYGLPKSGKTFLAMHIALCVATGILCLGCPVQPGLVIYIAAEMGARSQRRVRAWIDCHMGDAADGDPPFAIIPRMVNLLDELEVERLVATLESLVESRGKPVLIVIDTLARSMVGGDENSARDMGLAVAVGDRLRDRFNAAIALVHHSGKDAGKGARGSSALLGAADSYLYVEGDDAGNHVACLEWSRDGEAGKQYGFRLRQVELGTDADGDQVTTCVLQPSTVVPAKPRQVRRDVALDALHEAISEHGERIPESSTIPKGIKAVRLDTWKARWALRTGYDESTGNSVNVNFYKDKDGLLKAGKVAISKPYVWLTE